MQGKERKGRGKKEAVADDEEGRGE